MRRGGIEQELIAFIGQVTTGGRPKLVDGLHQARPRNHTSTPHEVGGEAAINGGVSDTKHAIGGHGMEPAHYIAKSRAGGR